MDERCKWDRMVDLTHPLHEKVPTWSGNCGFRLEKRIDYDQGLRVHTLKCHAGVGTHMDAPSHFIAGGKDIDQIPLEKFLAPACIIDVRKESHSDFLLEITHIERYEGRYGKIEPGSVVIAWTGWEAFWEEPEKYRGADASGKLHFPGFSPECAQLLSKRPIAGIGIDTLSPDGSNEGFPVHFSILGADQYILENLCGLGQLPPKGGYILCPPSPYCGGTEAPVRAVGFF